jgi:DNA-binding NarL/FixJ family response regulator
MPARQMTDTPLSPELDAIATAAADRLRAAADANTTSHDELQRRVAQAASAAIGTGAALGAIADAERAGQTRARGELGPDALKRIARASRRRREADAEYEQEILRAGRIGLTHREIANAAEVAHGTVRAILTRTDSVGSEPLPARDTVSANGGEPEHG